ncbi:hypothetical protein [Candidatus Electronema sp. PJ]|uniref:hypothetical protein n=1 Tax=Candidatus Electronema sp. PJ TaxID=3401572 RepID=UPI003AA832DB
MIRNQALDGCKFWFNKKTMLFLEGNLMALPGKTSAVITYARERAARLKAINPALDLGNGLTIRGFEALIAAAQISLDICHSVQPAQLEEARRNFEAAETQLYLLTARMLAAVGEKYGQDSKEYEMAGGRQANEIAYHPAKTEEEREGRV